MIKIIFRTSPRRVHCTGTQSTDQFFTYFIICIWVLDALQSSDMTWFHLMHNIKASSALLTSHTHLPCRINALKRVAQTGFFLPSWPILHLSATCKLPRMQQNIACACMAWYQGHYRNMVSNSSPFQEVLVASRRGWRREISLKRGETDDPNKKK